MTSKTNPFSRLKRSGQFGAEKGGLFAAEWYGQFKTESGGPFERNFQIDNQLPELEAEVDFLKIQHLSSDVVLQEAKDLYTRWPTLSFEAKRSIIETITSSIVIGKEDISLKLAYSPTHSQNAGNKQQNSTV